MERWSCPSRGHGRSGSPYRLLQGGTGEYWFDGNFPADVYNAIIAASEGIDDLSVVSGKTVAGNEFFLEQFRLDGAIRLETVESKMDWLRWLHDNGVRNIEMEGHARGLPQPLGLLEIRHDLLHTAQPA